ncbi:MAG: helix-turn-helix domain-containing protein [Balneolaceae bacterium]|nr:helix-turn-helix domain-containing protein [Balneolaceae bacterium]MBO6546422.1 helix-turn-helix domain-containing protein [Balneolaceae bacterium]MBO6648781.1 helix-turn-helix domain-containing protein [Balneolaceae bacterium]
MKIFQEHVGLSQSCPFLIRVFNQVDLSYPFHAHKEAFELTITEGIEGTRMVGDSTERFSEKDIVLISPGLPHCWQDYGIKPKGSHKVIVIHFLEELFTIQQASAPHLTKIFDGLKNSKFGLKLNKKGLEEAWEIVNELKEENNLSNYMRLLRLLHLFGESANTEKLCTEGYSHKEFKNEEIRLTKALQFIQENYTRKLMIKEVSDHVHISPSAFSHYFKSRTLKSFSEYILELRLGRAAQLLQNSDLQISMIGFESGFHNSSYFNSAFKKKYDTTPMKFRKKRRVI